MNRVAIAHQNSCGSGCFSGVTKFSSNAASSEALGISLKRRIGTLKSWSASSSTLRRSEMASTKRGRAVKGEQANQPLEARPLPEAQDFDEDVGPGGGVNGPVVGDPDAFAAQLDQVGCLADLPRRGDLAESLDERRHLGRHVSAGVLPVRDQCVA